MDHEFLRNVLLSSDFEAEYLDQLTTAQLIKLYEQCVNEVGAA